ANAARDTTCGWVVDVRGNGSTDVPVLLGSIAALLRAGPVLARVDRAGRHSDVVLTDDAVRTGDTLAVPLDPVARHDEPVVVLQDSGTSRAGEAVVLAFRDRSGSHSIGTPTFGAVTDGTTSVLADGALLYVSRWRLGDASGSLATGPVVPQESAPDEVALDAARAWLRGRCGG
ncbi:MAG: S41 family peptidase, partial [Actinomycetota bacterium]|nr:S41 family peptidase [Actinomycetota bacterium]